MSRPIGNCATGQNRFCGKYPESISKARSHCPEVILVEGLFDYAVLAEVDRRAKPFAGKPQIGEKLLSGNRRENLDRRDFDDHPKCLHFCCLSPDPLSTIAAIDGSRLE